MANAHFQHHAETYDVMQVSHRMFPFKSLVYLLTISFIIINLSAMAQSVDMEGDTLIVSQLVSQNKDAEKSTQ